MSHETENQVDPFNCDGCHDGDWAGFDHFCDALDVTDAETPHAFAAYLSKKTGWDGKYGRVEPIDR